VCVCEREKVRVCACVCECVYTLHGIMRIKEATLRRRVMSLLRLVSSLKMEVSFAKEPYKRDYILQKRPIF